MAETAQANSKTKADYVEEAKTLSEMLKTMDISKGQAGDDDYTFSWSESKNSHFVYLVSAQWFQLWKNKTSFELLEDGLDIEESNIGDEVIPRLNSDLIDAEAIKDTEEKFIQFKDERSQFLNLVIKPGLIENESFVFVTYDVWSYILEHYPDAYEIKRVAYSEYGSTKYEVNLIQINIYYIPNEKLDLLKEDPEGYIKKQKIQISKRLKIEELRDMLVEHVKDTLPQAVLPSKIRENHLGLYLLDNEVSFKQFRRSVNKHLKKKASYSIVKDIPVDCTMMDGDSSFVDKYKRDLGKDSDLIVLVKSYREFKFKPKREENSTSSEDGYGYSGGGYGSSGYNNFRHRGQSMNNKFKGFPKRTEDSKIGEVGLRNLGNTCFMNSALQCLSHTTDMTEYFLKRLWKLDKNEDNPLGSKGKLVDSFAELMFQMWNSTHSVVSPSRFKYEMGSFQNMFEGMSQHDSQEFLSHLLDGLHEDLNLIQKKPYTEGVEGSVEDDDNVIARKSWVNFLKRNYSQIMKFFYGQFRSETRCPNCSKTVITFDPYQLISLAVPKKVTKTISAYYVTENQNQVAKKVKFRVSYISNEDRTVQELIDAFAEENEVDASDFYLTFAGFTVFGFIVDSASSLQKMATQAGDTHFKPRPFLFKMDAEEKVAYNNPSKITVITLTRIKTKFSKESPSFTKFAFVNEKTTLKELYFLIFKKHAHYHDFDKTGLSMNESGDSDEPLQNVDYAAVFEKYFINGTDVQQFFDLVIEDGEEDAFTVPISDEQTIGQLALKFSDNYDQKKRTMKMIIEFKKESTNEIKINLMKKCQTSHTAISIAGKGSLTEGVNLEILLNKFSEPEQLDEQNTWYCSDCKDHVRAFKKIQIFKAPKHLIIHMKKLKQGGYGSYYSSEKPHNVEFPLVGLDMTHHVINKEPLINYNIQKEEFMDKENSVLKDRQVESDGLPVPEKLIYDCYGVINHYGSSYFGHYTAYVNRGEDDWNCADDSNFSGNSSNGVVTEAAYVLFYKLREEGAKGYNFCSPETVDEKSEDEDDEDKDSGKMDEETT